jgi:hypothetical protein
MNDACECVTAQKDANPIPSQTTLDPCEFPEERAEPNGRYWLRSAL